MSIFVHRHKFAHPYNETVITLFNAYRSNAEIRIGYKN